MPKAKATGPKDEHDGECESCKDKAQQITHLEAKIAYVLGAIEFVLETPLPGKPLKNLKEILNSCS